jgi:hypothetical protein
MSASTTILRPYSPASMRINFVVFITYSSIVIANLIAFIGAGALAVIPVSWGFLGPLADKWAKQHYLQDADADRRLLCHKLVGISGYLYSGSHTKDRAAPGRRILIYGLCLRGRE